MSAPPPEPVTVVLPVRDVAAGVAAVVSAWRSFLEKSHHAFEIVVVDDGSTDGTAAKLAEIAAKHGTVRVLTHESPRGYGAAIRTGLAAAVHPLVFFTAADYPYTPADLGKALKRIADVDEYLKRPIDIVAGCRTGRPTPAVWAVAGTVYRLFCRLLLGLPVDPPKGWFGLGGTVRAWLLWLVFADPLDDPFAAFVLVRKAVFARFPLQCDGDLVRVELIAKATFTECLIDEIALTPSPSAIPPVSWAGLGALFFRPEFTPPQTVPAAVS